jgi:hypothetical protein
MRVARLCLRCNFALSDSAASSWRQHQIHDEASTKVTMAPVTVPVVLVASATAIISAT